TNTPNELNVFHLRKFQHPIIGPASISKEAGAYAGEAIEIAAELFKQNLVDGIVTAPVSKEALKKAGYRFTGHTEMLSKIFDIENVLMLLIANKFRIGLATIHIPLSKVVRSLSKELIIKKITLLHTSLRNDLAIRTPRIAILGLNPHAGENGNIGNEEIRIITPAIQFVKRKGIIAYGPFSADGFFGTHAYKKYDAVLAMYHDQGLIPLKMLGFNVGRFADSSHVSRPRDCI
ncbi:MAG: 4-hydroxythreonine-4-phosphate dehydrogenase PdxA, partial [Ignavibacteriales bacterium]|nr:4-hydroxythreonine-4-phosphate dehydrogenase PdxA [Ignavibacteriales bacterium]